MIPLISVIIPIYNSADYIERCLNSIRNQTFANWEAILINDGSTDSSGTICEYFSSLDSRFKTVHQPNKGVSYSRNRGLEIAKGKWIWFIDADDYIVDGAMEILHNTMEGNECDVIFSGLINVFEDGTQTKDRYGLRFSSRQQLLENVMAFQNGMLLFSNEKIAKYNLKFSTDIKIGEDLEFQYKFLIHCTNPITTGCNLYVYHRNPMSAMSNPCNSKNRFSDPFKVACRIIDYAGINDAGTPLWLCLRIKKLIKSGLLSLAKSFPYHIGIGWQMFNQTFKIIRKSEFKDVMDLPLKTSVLFLPIYLICIKIMLRWKTR